MRSVNIANKAFKLSGSALSKIAALIASQLENAEITYNPKTNEVGVKFRKEV